MKEGQTMKKTYFAPETTVVTVNTRHFFAASLGDLTESGGIVDLTEESADEGSSSWSRQGGVWDDDEDYDD